MSKPSKIGSAAPELRAEVDRLLENGVSLRAIAQWLCDRGFDVSSESVRRYSLACEAKKAEATPTTTTTASSNPSPIDHNQPLGVVAAQRLTRIFLNCLTICDNRVQLAMERDEPIPQREIKSVAMMHAVLLACTSKQPGFKDSLSAYEIDTALGTQQEPLLPELE